MEPSQEAFEETCSTDMLVVGGSVGCLLADGQRKESDDRNIHRGVARGNRVHVQATSIQGLHFGGLCKLHTVFLFVCTWCTIVYALRIYKMGCLVEPKVGPTWPTQI